VTNRAAYSRQANGHNYEKWVKGFLFAEFIPLRYIVLTIYKRLHSTINKFVVLLLVWIINCIAPHKYENNKKTFGEYTAISLNKEILLRKFSE